MLKHLGWLWTTSAVVCEGKGLILATRRIRFYLKALGTYSSIKPMVEAPRESSLGKLMQHRPEVVGAVVWPYQCAGWSAHTRLARIRDHYAIVDKLGGGIDFPVHGKITLLELEDIRAGFRVIVDQPVWFMREGQLAINLFVDETRLYTLAFSFFQNDDGIAAFIGAIQGRDIDGALEEYRELTKATHGMRPRDFLVEMFRFLCLELGVAQIYAVSNEYRHHKDQRYFGSESAKKLSANYNEIWADRRGVRVDPMYFKLDLDEPERDLATIPAKKRSMYRRRFEMLRNIKQQMHETCGSLGIIKTVRKEADDARETELSVYGRRVGQQH